MQQIKAVGFDMDYTLAQYNLDFELLAYEGAKKKLVYDYKYPVRTANPSSKHTFVFISLGVLVVALLLCAINTITAT